MNKFGLGAQRAALGLSEGLGGNPSLSKAIAGRRIGGGPPAAKPAVGPAKPVAPAAGRGPDVGIKGKGGTTAVNNGKRLYVYGDDEPLVGKGGKRG